VNSTPNNNAPDDNPPNETPYGESIRVFSDQVSDFNMDAADVFTYLGEGTKVGTIDASGRLDIRLPETIAADDLRSVYDYFYYFIFDEAYCSFTSQDEVSVYQANFYVSRYDQHIGSLEQLDQLEITYGPDYTTIDADVWVYRFYADADASIKGTCEVDLVEFSLKTTFDLQAVQGWNLVVIEITDRDNEGNWEQVSLSVRLPPVETKWFYWR
jgi:hypothetical protein